jgi:hypothetical protein
MERRIWVDKVDNKVPKVDKAVKDKVAKQWVDHLLVLQWVKMALKAPYLKEETSPEKDKVMDRVMVKQISKTLHQMEWDNRWMVMVANRLKEWETPSHLYQWEKANKPSRLKMENHNLKMLRLEK